MRAGACPYPRNVANQNWPDSFGCRLSSARSESPYGSVSYWAQSGIMLNMPTRDELEVNAIQRDAEFVGRFISRLQRVGMSSMVSSVAHFCMFPFMSLFVYESAATLSRLAPQVSCRCRAPRRTLWLGLATA
jgi:hypothetical protein